MQTTAGNSLGTGSARNLRSVWAINPEPSAWSHYASFPTNLVIPCVKSATSEKGCCPHCGSQWARVVEREAIPHSHGGHQGYNARGNRDGMSDMSNNPRFNWKTDTLFWLPTCSCPPHDPIPSVIFDPFAGTSTTLVVAKALGRRGVGVELSQDYCDMSAKRLAHASMKPKRGKPQEAVTEALL